MLAKNIFTNTYQLPANLAPALRFHAFRLAHNALPTRMRDRWRHGLTDCSFCGLEPETLAHLHTQCPATALAVSKITHYTPDKGKTLILRTAEPDDYVFRSSSVSPADQLTLLIFSCAIWRSRSNFTSRHHQPSFQTVGADQITAMFRQLRSSTTKSPRVRDRTKQRADFLRLLAALPPSTLVYTDGSSYGNPGPAGAGFLIDDSSYHSFSLGQATNNVAELSALHKAVTSLLDSPPSLPIVFFIDNLFTINIAERKWIGRSNKKLIRQLLQALDQLRRVASFSFAWVPGHASIIGNEIADWLAKRGACGTTSSVAPPPHVLQGNFPPPEFKIEHEPVLPLLLSAISNVSSSSSQLPSPAPHVHTATTQRRSSRTRAAPSIVAGIDFSMMMNY